MPEWHSELLHRYVENVRVKSLFKFRALYMKPASFPVDPLVDVRHIEVLHLHEKVKQVFIGPPLITRLFHPLVVHEGAPPSIYRRMVIGRSSQPRAARVAIVLS